MRSRLTRLKAALTPTAELPRAAFACYFGDAGVIYEDNSAAIAPWMDQTLGALFDAAPAGWPLKLYGFDSHQATEPAERQARV